MPKPNQRMGRKIAVAPTRKPLRAISASVAALGGSLKRLPTPRCPNKAKPMPANSSPVSQGIQASSHCSSAVGFAAGCVAGDPRVARRSDSFRRLIGVRRRGHPNTTDPRRPRGEPPTFHGSALRERGAGRKSNLINLCKALGSDSRATSGAAFLALVCRSASSPARWAARSCKWA
jgi:hypothetical protein